MKTLLMMLDVSGNRFEAQAFSVFSERIGSESVFAVLGGI
jgi:hypothetical protein